jgi:hypothetical protein
MRTSPGPRVIARYAVRIALVAVLLVVCLCGAASVALVSGLATLRAGERAFERGRPTLAAGRFATADKQLAIADRILSPLAATFGWVGALGDSVSSAANVSGGGEALAQAGAEVVRAAGQLQGQRVGPGVPRALDRAASDVGTAVERLQPAGGNSPIVALNQVQGNLERAARPLASVVRTGAVLAALAQSRGSYLVIVQNSAELRATGGIVGVVGVIKTGGGRLELERLATDRGLPAGTRSVSAPADFSARYDRFGARRTWVNANMSPDFPTSAGVLLGLYERDTKRRLDGVLSVDAVGLSRLLETVGPVRAGGGVTLTPGHFLTQALVDAYRRPSGQRGEILLAGARAGFESLTSSRRLWSMARALGDSAAEGHFLFFARRTDLERRAISAGIAGRVATPPGDYLMVILQNAAGNKLDYYMSSTIQYDVWLRRNGTGSATLELTLHNRAPRSGLPDYVIGRRLPGDPPGLTRTWVSAYASASAGVTGFSGPAGPTVEPGVELGHTVDSWFQAADPSHSSSARLELQLPRVVDQRGRYRLLVQAQPMLNPARLVVRLDGRVLFDGPLLQAVALSAAP